SEEDSVTINLLADGEETDKTIELSDDNDWSYVFTDLDAFDDKGEAIEYTVEEEKVAGYESEITGSAEGGFTVTNTRTGKTEVPVKKVWQGSKKDSVTIKLLADGEEVETVDLMANEDWSHVFTDLDAFDEDGQPITYTVKEVVGDERNEAYDSKVTGDAEDGFTVTNTRTAEASIKVSKEWKDDGAEASDRPDTITVNLLANGTVIREHDVKAVDDWTLTIDELAKYDEFGKEIEYSITEHDIAGYESEVDEFDITNTRVDEKSITITKAWEEKYDKYRPEAIEVELFRSIEDGDLESVDTYEVTAENDWELTIDELPAFDENGKAYTYEVEEEGIAEYNSSVNGFDITNTQKTYAIGDYVWVDKNKDGIQDANEDPLEGVKVELYDEDGEKIAENETDEDGRYIFDELPAGDYKVKFELTEEQEEKYRFTKEQAGDDSTVDYDADEETGWTRDIVLDEDNEELTKEYDAQEFSATEGIDPTWDAGVIELVDIPVEKVWKDNDNAEESRPDAITVHVVVDGNEDPVAIGNLTAEDGWSHIFKGLDKYDENGGEINYSVEEEAVEGYKGEVEETEEGFVITNTEIIEQTPLEPSKTTVDVEKVWKGEKQDSVTIHLLAN